MTAIRYISTRGRSAPVSFLEATLTGLAPDGGLLIPERIPDVRARLPAWAKLSYPELAVAVMREFVDLPEKDLQELVGRSYTAFAHPEIVPLVPAGTVRIVELFHGPTLAFKDIALQFLGHLFEYALERTGRRLNILAATSGDTGSAAICGVRGRKNINIFVMHPHGRVSSLQEKQMTSVLDANVFNLAVRGTFDDCQHIMKSVFRDAEFKERHALGAVNSVNWARILAQIVYYFYAGLQAQRATGAAQVRFSVPTGNFGDILAGYYAARMGLPVGRLILATNENDILARFFNAGVYQVGAVRPTISPSMDIQVASNFERYLYYRTGEDAAALRLLMEQFERTGTLALPGQAAGAPVDPLFAAHTGSTAATLATIRRYYNEFGYLADPHTAVGIYAAEQAPCEEGPLLCLATAHPAKFSQAILDALGRDVAEAHHPILEALRAAPTRCEVVPNDARAVRDFVAARAL